MIYFSFSIYGTNPKYTHGVIANAEILQRRFPEARVAVYVASDVPADIVTRLHEFPNVLVIPTERRHDSGCRLDRFLTIDREDCDVMFVRDADSRVHERDAACIEDFLAAPDKQLHIIRDHFYHDATIMGGMWGIRKPALLEPITLSIDKWRKNHISTCDKYYSDQAFLNHLLYNSRLLSVAMIHDRMGRYEPAASRTPFRVPIIDKLFVGQVHEYKEDGSEYCVFDA